MRHRPKRENYPRGVYGDIDYYERLERYCTYLENKNKALTEQCNIANVVGQSEQLKALEDLKDFAYDNCQPHNSDRLAEIMERL